VELEARCSSVNERTLVGYEAYRVLKFLSHICMCIYTHIQIYIRRI
jgi:hypothetical protein